MFSLVKVWLEMRNHLENSFVWLVLYFYMHVYTIDSNCRLLSALSECRHILSRTVTSVVLGHISSQVLRSVCSFMMNLIVGIFPRECCPLKEESVLGSPFLHVELLYSTLMPLSPKRWNVYGGICWKTTEKAVVLSCLVQYLTIRSPVTATVNLFYSYKCINSEVLFC